MFRESRKANASFTIYTKYRANWKFFRNYRKTFVFFQKKFCLLSIHIPKLLLSIGISEKIHCTGWFGKVCTYSYFLYIFKSSYTLTEVPGATKQGRNAPPPHSSFSIKSLIVGGQTRNFKQQGLRTDKIVNPEVSDHDLQIIIWKSRKYHRFRL